MDTNCDVSFVETKRMSSENVYILAFLRKTNYVEVEGDLIVTVP